MKKKRKDIETLSKLYWKNYWKNRPLISAVWAKAFYWDSLHSGPKRKRNEWNYIDYDGYYRITKYEYRQIHRRRRKEAKHFCKEVFELVDVDTCMCWGTCDCLNHISDGMPYPVQKYNIWWW